MAVSATIICDSVSPDGIRLTTMHLRYPRMIHSEFMTHRVFSRNGRSSRAVPVSVLIKEDPYVPHFMLNQPGMVASQEMDIVSLNLANKIWLEMVEACKSGVEQLNQLKVHKQWANRPLEWFGYIDVLVSSTDWANFFVLRDETGAQPEIDDLAKSMKVAMDESRPFPLAPGEWHLPYIESEDLKVALEYAEHNELEAIEILKKISVARCARLTIKPFDGNGSIEKELERYKLLMVSRPVHASPAEHIATPDSYKTIYHPHTLEIVRREYLNKKEWGNFYGWRQFRKMIPFNTIEDR